MKKITRLNISCIITIIFASAGMCSAASNLALATSFNAFGFKLYQQIYNQLDPFLEQKQLNTVVSPYGLSSGLALLGLGASGEIQLQIYNTLQLHPVPTDLGMQLDTSNFSLMDQLSTTKNSDQQLDIANAVWMQQGLMYKQKFLQEMQSIKSNTFMPIDFATNPVKATQTINHWIAQKTENTILNLIPENAINITTKLVLTNAIYFKGTWKYPFDESATSASQFMLGTGRPASAPAPLMFQQSSLPYVENSELQMVMLPYANSHLAMAILLPKTSSSIHDITQSLTNDKFSQLISTLQEQNLQLYLPRFNISSTFTDLSQTLQLLGINTAFSNKANFSNITQEPLAVSAIIQQAIIKVDEKGTVAAAATGVIDVVTAMAPTKPILMRADHPFIFILFDQQTKMILFMGQVMDPT